MYPLHTGNQLIDSNSLLGIQCFFSNFKQKWKHLLCAIFIFFFSFSLTLGHHADKHNQNVVRRQHCIVIFCLRTNHKHFRNPCLVVFQFLWHLYISTWDRVIKIIKNKIDFELIDTSPWKLFLSILI